MYLSRKALERLKGYESLAEVRAYLDGLEAQDRVEEPKPVASMVEVPPMVPKKPSMLNRNRGAQADVYRMLFTGPAGLDAVCKALPGYTRDTLRQAIGRMLDAKEITVAATRPGEPEVATLTPQGRERAAWFVAHPYAKLDNRHRSKT